MSPQTWWHVCIYAEKEKKDHAQMMLVVITSINSQGMKQKTTKEEQKILSVRSCLNKMRIQKHIKEVAQNLSEKLLEGVANTAILTNTTQFAIWPRRASYHSTSTGLRAQLLWIPVDGHTFLLPGGSAIRSALVQEREKDTLGLSCCN